MSVTAAVASVAVLTADRRRAPAVARVRGPWHWTERITVIKAV